MPVITFKIVSIALGDPSVAVILCEGKDDKQDSLEIVTANMAFAQSLSIGEDYPVRYDVVLSKAEPSHETEGRCRQALSYLREISRQDDLLSTALRVKTNQFPGLMSRLDEAIRQRDASMLQNKRLISANDVLNIAVTAKTNQVEDLTARLDSALLWKAEWAKAIRQRDEATQKNDELPAANKALKAANEILFDTLTARTAQVDSLTGRLNNVMQLNGELRDLTHALNSELAQALQQRDRLQHKLNSIIIAAK